MKNMNALMPGTPSFSDRIYWILWTFQGIMRVKVSLFSPCAALTALEDFIGFCRMTDRKMEGLPHHTGKIEMRSITLIQTP
jgi:hypothetical protein